MSALVILLLLVISRDITYSTLIPTFDSGYIFNGTGSTGSRNLWSVKYCNRFVSIHNICNVNQEVEFLL